MSDRRKFNNEEAAISEAAEAELSREILKEAERQEKARVEAGLPRPPLFPHLKAEHAEA
jgi:hypothetical protein